jgi:isocitrate dehydrogenase (NAD+)
LRPVQEEKRVVITGRSDGATGTGFTDYIMDQLNNPKLKQTWEEYVYVES